MSSPILLAPEGCDGCGDVRLLYARTVIGNVCSSCYIRRGKPMGAAGEGKTIYEIEAETRMRMLARGGSYAHLVRKGLT